MGMWSVLIDGVMRADTIVLSGIWKRFEKARQVDPTLTVEDFANWCSAVVRNEVLELIANQPQAKAAGV